MDTGQTYMESPFEAYRHMHMLYFFLFIICSVFLFRYLFRLPFSSALPPSKTLMH
jgi:hypothetical protein